MQPSQNIDVWKSVMNLSQTKSTAVLNKTALHQVMARVAETS